MYVPRAAPCPVPWKYIDVTRDTQCIIGKMLQRSIDEYWNVDWNRDLSDAWTGFSRFTILDEAPPDGFSWSEVRLTRKQATSRPDSLWPEMWKDMSEASK